MHLVSVARGVSVLGPTESMSCIDLVAAAGQLSLAARRVSLRVRLAANRDKFTIATYGANLRLDDPPVALEDDIAAMQAARIQIFPDDNMFHGELTKANRQAGNAVLETLDAAVMGDVASPFEAAGSMCAVAHRNESVAA